MEREEEIKYLEKRRKYLIKEKFLYGPRVIGLIGGIPVFLLFNHFGTDMLTDSTPLTLLFSGIIIGLTIAVFNYLLKIEDELKDIEFKLDAFDVDVKNEKEVKDSIKKEQKRIKRKRKNNGV